jgi:hypothetical protein
LLVKGEKRGGFGGRHEGGRRGGGCLNQRRSQAEEETQRGEGSGKSQKKTIAGVCAMRDGSRGPLQNQRRRREMRGGTKHRCQWLFQICFAKNKKRCIDRYVFEGGVFERSRATMPCIVFAVCF